MDRNDELMHYGVKGQKWGVRRTPEQLGHKTNGKNKPKKTMSDGELHNEIRAISKGLGSLNSNITERDCVMRAKKVIQDIYSSRSSKEDRHKLLVEVSQWVDANVYDCSGIMAVHKKTGAMAYRPYLDYAFDKVEIKDIPKYLPGTDADNFDYYSWGDKLDPKTGEVLNSWEEFKHSDDELMHYGRKGMKWGQNIYGKIKTYNTNRKRKKNLAKARAARAEKAKQEEERAKQSAKNAGKPKAAKYMTEEELNKAIARLELEKRYIDLMRQTDTPKQVTRGQKFVSEVIENSGRNIATQTTTFVMGYGMNKVLEKAFGDPQAINPKKGQKDK